MDTFEQLQRFAEIMAIQAEIEGMKAENMHRVSAGETIAYREDAFLCKADEIRNAINRR